MDAEQAVAPDHAGVTAESFLNKSEEEIKVPPYLESLAQPPAVNNYRGLRSGTRCQPR